MRVLVCGDRHWTNKEKIYNRLSMLPKDAEVIHGAAPGADNIAGSVAISLGLKVRTFPADWEKFGKWAGPKRNREMLDQKPDYVIAFHPNLAESKGTRDTVTEAKRRNIPVELVT